MTVWLLPNNVELIDTRRQVDTNKITLYKTCYRKVISGVQEQSPWSRDLGQSPPPEAESLFAFGRVILQLVGPKFLQGGRPYCPPRRRCVLLPVCRYTQYPSG